MLRGRGMVLRGRIEGMVLREGEGWCYVDIKKWGWCKE